MWSVNRPNLPETILIALMYEYARIQPEIRSKRLKWLEESNKDLVAAAGLEGGVGFAAH